MLCPRCESTSIKKYGAQFGKQRYKCLECNRSFTEGAQPIGRPKSAPEIDPRVKKIQKIFDLLDQLVYPDPPETLDQIKEAIESLVRDPEDIRSSGSESLISDRVID